MAVRRSWWLGAVGAGVAGGLVLSVFHRCSSVPTPQEASQILVVQLTGPRGEALGPGELVYQELDESRSQAVRRFLEAHQSSWRQIGGAFGFLWTIEIASQPFYRLAWENPDGTSESLTIWSDGVRYKDDCYLALGWDDIERLLEVLYE